MWDPRRWQVRCDWVRPSINPYIHMSESGVEVQRCLTRRGADRAKRRHEANLAPKPFGGSYVIVVRRRGR
jgi:hypothetical protein